MVGIDTIVWFVFISIVVIAVLALLWFAIGYAEARLPMPMAWNVVRLVFVLLCVFLLVSVLLAMIGHPVVRM